MSKLRLTKLSLFSGIGGDDLASEWAGIETYSWLQMVTMLTTRIRLNWITKHITCDLLNQRKITSTARCFPTTKLVSRAYVLIKAVDNLHLISRLIINNTILAVSQRLLRRHRLTMKLLRDYMANMPILIQFKIYPIYKAIVEVENK